MTESAAPATRALVTLRQSTEDDYLAVARAIAKPDYDGVGVDRVAFVRSIVT